MSSIPFRQRTHTGFSVLELLIYIAVLTVVTVLVVNSIFNLTGSYANLQVSRSLVHSGNVALERMIRELRRAESVTIGASTFNVHPGALVISSAATTTAFTLSGSELVVSENGVASGELTKDDVEVTEFIVRYADNGRTDIVQIELELHAQNGDISKTKRFYTSAVVRGAY